MNEDNFLKEATARHLLPGSFHVPTPDAYRRPFNEAVPKKHARLCLAAA